MWCAHSGLPATSSQMKQRPSRSRRIASKSNRRRSTRGMMADVALDRARSVSEMERRILGATDLAITPVGIGTAPIGSGRDWAAWWGPQDEAESIRAIHTALDRGVNWIDTAPFYGWGRAEEIVGRAR